VTAKGRSIIGWDEILEGGLSANATVMSWRGVEGGIAAAKENHDVIMTPTSFTYLDYYQADPAGEPLAIGGFVPIEKTYSFEPVPSELDANQAARIIGVQGNIWTEYIDNQSYLEYMAYPRAIAVAELGWSPKAMKNWNDFSFRLRQHFLRLDAMKVNYSKRMMDVKATPGMINNKMIINLSSVDASAEIRYTTDGSQPTSASTLATTGIILDKNTTLKANIFRGNEVLGKMLTKNYLVNKATGHSYTLANQPKGYTGGDQLGLTNGIKGTLAEMASWVGFSGKDLDMVIDLGESTTINNVSANFNQTPWAWILHPGTMEVSLSEDGKVFNDVQTVNRRSNDVSGSSVENRQVQFAGKKARFIKVKVANFGKIPEGNAGANQDAWLFCDEIVVE
jgi:hexosaminidase